MKRLSIVMLLGLQPAAHAELAGKLITHPRSACRVGVTPGAYPTYAVVKGAKTIYQPKSDGIDEVSFSPSGRYIAFGGGAINLIDIEPGKLEFSIVILDCQTEKTIGFHRGGEVDHLVWDNDDSGLSFSEHLPLGGSAEKKP